MTLFSHLAAPNSCTAANPKERRRVFLKPTTSNSKRPKLRNMPHYTTCLRSSTLTLIGSRHCLCEFNSRCGGIIHAKFYPDKCEISPRPRQHSHYSSSARLMLTVCWCFSAVWQAKGLLYVFCWLPMPWPMLKRQKKESQLKTRQFRTHQFDDRVPRLETNRSSKSLPQGTARPSDAGARRGSRKTPKAR